jgi:hypothetical protein
VPGDYILSLKADGNEQKAKLRVDSDPRVAGAGYRASADFSEKLREPMAMAWRGYAEAGAVREGLERVAPGLNDLVLREDLRVLAGTLAGLTGDSGFKRDSSVLAGIETALEDSDAAPTAAMQTLFVETKGKLARDLAVWDGLRSRDLAALNARLAKAGVKRIAIPPPAELHVRAPEGGQDLP